MEQHGLPPLVLSFESMDGLDHVIFVYQSRGRWGSVARSRDPGLHGRRPVFATPRALALSYVDPYVDLSGAGEGVRRVNDLRVMDGYDWRLSDRNVWKVERMLLDYPHRRIRTSNTRFRACETKYRAFKQEFPESEAGLLPAPGRWTPLPPEWKELRSEEAEEKGVGSTGAGSSRPRDAETSNPWNAHPEPLEPSKVTDAAQPNRNPASAS